MGDQPVSPEQWEQLDDAVRAIEPLLVEVKPGQDSPADRMPEIGLTDWTGYPDLLSDLSWG